MQLKHNITTSECFMTMLEVLKVEMIKFLKKICENTNKQQDEMKKTAQDLHMARESKMKANTVGKIGNQN